MALSGSFTKGFSNNGAFRLRVEWSATQNINENYSTVTAHLYIDSLQSWASVYDATSSNTSLSINGNTKYFSNNSTINAWQSKWMGSHTVTVYHTNDGSKWFDIYATHNFDITWNGSYIGVVDVYGSAWLNTIPRASVPTVATTDIQYGDSIHVNLNRASEDFTHYVSIDIGNVKTDIGAMDRHTNSFDFVLPFDWCARIPTLNANSGKFTVHTYNGNGGYIGTNEVWFTATVPASVVPTISAEQVTHDEAVEGLASKFNAYVQSKSKIRATVAGTGAFVGGVQCSSVVGHKIEMNGQIFNSNDATSEVLNVSGNQTIKYTVTDSRGRTASRTATISVLPYSAPVLSLLKASRCDADGTPNDEGEYAKVTVGAAVSDVDNLNDKIFTISKKTVTSEVWTDQNIASAAYTIETDVIISGISGNNAWDIKFTVNDYFSTDEKVSKTMQLSTAFSLIDYFNGGKGLAFGKVAEKEGFENNLKTWFTGGIEAIPLPSGDNGLAYWQSLGGGFYILEDGTLAGQPTPRGAVNVYRHETDGIAECISYSTAERWYLRFTSEGVGSWVKIQNQIYTPTKYHPALGTGWWNYKDWGGGDFAYVSFVKTHENIVSIQGLLYVEYGYGTNNAIIFTLPEGYRPTGTLIFNQRSDSSAEHSRIEVHPDGTVTFNGATNSMSWVSLAGISFLAEN